MVQDRVHCKENRWQLSWKGPRVAFQGVVRRFGQGCGNTMDAAGTGPISVEIIRTEQRPVWTSIGWNNDPYKLPILCSLFFYTTLLLTPLVGNGPQRRRIWTAAICLPSGHHLPVYHYQSNFWVSFHIFVFWSQIDLTNFILIFQPAQKE